jgi:integrase
MNMREIKPADVEKFKSISEKILTQRGTKKKPATIVRELSVLSTVFSEAVNNDFIDYNPCSRVKKPSFDNTQNRVLRYEDEEKFFAAFRSDWAKEICVLVLNTGLRNNDALKLSKSHIDWNREMICLTQGKTQRRVEIPMNETVQKLIRSKWDNKGELLFPNPRTGKLGISIKRAMTGAAERAGVEHLTIRDLRRTFGTRLDELNYSSSVKAKLLGHGDLRSVHRYERGSKILRDAVLELEKKNPSKILPEDKKGAVLEPVNKGVKEGNPTKILPESERAYEQSP